MKDLSSSSFYTFRPRSGTSRPAPASQTRSGSSARPKNHTQSFELGFFVFCHGLSMLLHPSNPFNRKDRQPPDSDLIRRFRLLSLGLTVWVWIWVSIVSLLAQQDLRKDSGII